MAVWKGGHWCFRWCRDVKDWVQAAEVRLRADGHVFFGEAYIVPRGGRAGVDQIARAVDHAMSLNWRLHDLTVMPVERLPRERS